MFCVQVGNGIMLLVASSKPTCGSFVMWPGILFPEIVAFESLLSCSMKWSLELSWKNLLALYYSFLMSGCKTLANRMYSRTECLLDYRWQLSLESALWQVAAATNIQPKSLLMPVFPTQVFKWRKQRSTNFEATDRQDSGRTTYQCSLLWVWVHTSFLFCESGIWMKKIGIKHAMDCCMDQ